MNTTKYYIILSSLILSACAFGTRVKMPEGLPTPQVPAIEITQKPLDSSFKPVIHIAQVKDMRSRPALIKESDTDEKTTNGDIGLSVQYALRKAFRSRGFTVSDKAPLVVAVKIDKWVATKSKNQIVSEAAVNVDIIGPDNSSLYSNTYDSFTTSEADLNEMEIMGQLELAMSNALKQILDDDNLVTILTAY